MSCQLPKTYSYLCSTGEQGGAVSSRDVSRQAQHSLGPPVSVVPIAQDPSGCLAQVMHCSTLPWSTA